MPRNKHPPHRRITRFMYKKIPLEDLPFTTVRITLHALKWIFLMVFLFVTIGIFTLFLMGGENYVQLILGYSIAGFFTFFMGYFGWTLAVSIMEMISGKEYHHTDRGISHYIGRKTKFRF